MAPLPSNRVNPAPVFAETGLDVMGHFNVKMNGRADHKVWVAVFTCFVSRAVHVELLYNMSPERDELTPSFALQPGAQALDDLHLIEEPT